ncbi:MAG TPA: HD domain-containing phosphohydrolase [Gemmatimonadales bacterium]|jgi:putative two-component system response regulator
MRHEPWRDARILIIDDEPPNIAILEHILGSAGYPALVTTTDPRQAVELFREHHPDLILLDLKMPHLDGHELLALFKREIPAETYLPILVLTSDATPDARRRALAGGAQDFLTKPFSPLEVRLRVENLVETRRLHLALASQNAELEERVRERTAQLTRRAMQLEQARIEILERLARAAEFRDDATGLHTRRVGCVAAQLMDAIGRSSVEVESIERAAPLHDIGKIGIPDSVLLKSGRLNEEEFAVIKTHTVIGGQILSGSDVSLLAVGREIALSHHERWDGTGYPAGLAGDAIPLSGRVVAVADVFDALTHPRPYKPAWTFKDALTEIQDQAGRQFDPDVVRTFATLFREGRLTERALA